MQNYKEFLKTEVFKTDEYLQFSLLLDAISQFDIDTHNHTAILERAYIYSGKSIFSGLVEKSKASVIDYKCLSASERSGFQASWIEKATFNFQEANHQIKDLGAKYEFSFDSLDCDSLIIPNVLHHCRDFKGLLEQIVYKFPNLDEILIFDSYLREEHQIPDDYQRYTPSGLKTLLNDLNFQLTRQDEVGNVFDAILYFISQAQEVLKFPELSETRKLLNVTVIPNLKQVRESEKYRPLGRAHANIATGFAMIFKKK